MKNIKGNTQCFRSNFSRKNILDVLKDKSKLDPEVRIYLESENKFTEKNTTTSYNKNSYISGVIKSLKQKIDAPVKRKKTK